MGKGISIWQPKTPWLSITRVTVLVVFSPILLIAWALTPVLWLVRKVFPPSPMSAADIVANLTVLIEYHGDEFAVGDAIDELQDNKAASPEVEALRQRIFQLGDPPWNEATIDELKAIRERVQALAAGGQV